MRPRTAALISLLLLAALAACPECTAKLCWAAGVDPRERYARLAEFCAAQGLEEERRFFEASLRALEKS